MAADLQQTAWDAAVQELQRAEIILTELGPEDDAAWHAYHAAKAKVGALSREAREAPSPQRRGWYRWRRRRR